MRITIAETMNTVARMSGLVHWFGDPVLRTKCEELRLEGGDLEKELSKELVHVLTQVREITGLGRGLAAPQIGVTKRMFVVFYEDVFETIINPRVVQQSQEFGVYPEMCLSGLPLAANVIRPWQIELEYYDLFGEMKRRLCDPFLSRIVLHEIDHLNGVLCLDRAEIQTLRYVFDFDEYKATSQLDKC